MKIQPEITYRNLEHSAAIDQLINEKIAKLERLCSYINRCEVVVEKAQDRPKHGSPYRVRVDITVPPSHELVGESNPSGDTQHVPLEKVVRDAFSKVERQLKDLTGKQRDSEHSKINVGGSDTTAIVTKIFREDGYGFIKTVEDGEDIYFHRNSVIHGDFDRIEIGTGVSYVAVEGEQGLQASSVHIVDKLGSGEGTANEQLIEPPLGWR